MRYSLWNVAGYDRADAVALTRSGINPLSAVLLASRGIHTKREAELLLDDSDSALLDPLRLPDIRPAAERIFAAIKRGEKMAVYGDYDVDGITATSLLSDYLCSLGADCMTYIPERLEEGYGVKNAALDLLCERGVKLIITVDCGITAFDEAKYAKERGLDLIITDHHECASVLPCAAAIVNPNRADCDYPSGMLAGVGVAFKLVCAMAGSDHIDELFERYGDLVALGTVADVMPVTGENRVFIRHGIERLRAGARPGVRKLCAAAGVNEKQITAVVIGFVIAPRLNAAGRMGNADRAVKLLTTKNEDEAADLAEELCETNRERQRTEGEMFTEAVGMADALGTPTKPIVLAGENWHQGVAGIVASRISERYGLPAVMICVQNGMGRGSCRSIPGFNIYEALAGCADLLEKYGGHAMAAGLSVKAENVAALKARLGEFYSTANIEESSLGIDFEVIKPGLLTVENVDALSLLQPYGSGNPQPVLCIMDADVDMVKPLSEGKHTKLWIQKNGEGFECVCFGTSPDGLGVRSGMKCDLAFTPQVNEFRGRRSVQLLLTDVRESGGMK